MKELLIELLLQVESGKGLDGRYSLPLRNSGGGAGYASFIGTRKVSELLIHYREEGLLLSFRTFDSSELSLLRHLFRFRIPVRAVLAPPGTFESRCPVIDLLFRIAHSEYQRAAEGEADTELLSFIEESVRIIRKNDPSRFSCTGARDSDLEQRTSVKLERIALDPVYSWKERLRIARSEKKSAAAILATKRRVQGVGLPLHRVFDCLHPLPGILHRFRLRPRVNLIGLIDHVLMDPLRWFSGVVRSNLGYSIALAVYSPFTFFFITQPMNPHAMWAVGKVRNGSLALLDRMKEPAPSATPVIPQTALLPDDDWNRRMSRMKSLQIQMEQRYRLSARIGRLDQIETQWAWPVTLEGAFHEASRYLATLSRIREKGTPFSPGWSGFLQAERRRTEHFRIYLLKRIERFILDHPYLILDRDREQGTPGAAALRVCSVYLEMRKSLQESGHAGALTAIPAQILGIRPESGNSLPLHPDEESLIRHWEKLYLIQSRAEESANLGLQTVLHSVRNTVFVFQLLLNEKREDLESKFFRSPSPPETASRNRMEHLRDLLALEYRSLSVVLKEALPDDPEMEERERLFSDLDASLGERALLR